MAGAEGERIRALQEEVQALGRELYRRCEAEHCTGWLGAGGGGAAGGGAAGPGGGPVERLRGAMKSKKVMLNEVFEDIGFEYEEPDGYEGEAVPIEYECRIMHTIMTDPVVGSDGLLYEARALQRWYTLQLGMNRDDPSHEVVGVYRKPLTAIAHRQLKVQKKIDAWVRDVGERGPQALNGRELLPSERGSWINLITLPLDELGRIARQYDEGCEAILKVLADNRENHFERLSSSLETAGLVVDKLAYKDVLSVLDNEISECDYSAPIDRPMEWLEDVLKHAGRTPTQEMKGYPEDRMACLLQKYRADLVRETAYAYLSRSRLPETDLGDQERPWRRVDFEAVLQSGLFPRDPPRGMKYLHREMASLGLDTAHFWVVQGPQSTESLRVWWKGWSTWNREFLISTMGRMYDKRSGEEAAGAKVIYDYARSLLAGLWFLQAGADPSWPEPPPSAPAAYDVPGHLLALWPDYPRDRYACLKAVKIFEGVIAGVMKKESQTFPKERRLSSPKTVDLWIHREMVRLMVIPIGPRLTDAMTGLDWYDVRGLGVWPSQ